MKNRSAILITLFRILIPATLLVVMYFLSGCGSKKKLVEKSEFTTEFAKVERVNELTSTDVKLDLEINTGATKLTTNENDIVDAEINDPNKDFELNKETKDGKTTYTGKNIKNFKVSNEKASEQSKDTSAVKQSKIAKSKKTKDSEAETKGKASGKEKEIDLKVERGFPWHWVILAVLLYSIFSYFGKSFNPFKWF